MSSFNSTKEMTEEQISEIEIKRLKNQHYYFLIEKACKFIIPRNLRVLEIGCATGRLLAATKPSYGLGIDINEKQITAARQIHASNDQLEFKTENIDQMYFSNIEPFDYILISDVLPLLNDVQEMLTKLREVSTSHTRIIITYHSNLWQPIMKIATLIGRRSPDPSYNWLSTHDIKNLLSLAGFETITHFGKTLLPVRIPIVDAIVNRFVASLPLINRLCLTWIMVAKPVTNASDINQEKADPSVSILIPTRNEKGNIEKAFTTTPKMGKWSELVFVDGNSTDGTVEEIERCIEQYGSQWHRCLLLKQTGIGKGQAVRQGFEHCQADILMILDSDLTMPPEQLTKFYDAIATGKGEFINGCRLVYPMEKQAMRFLNMIANHIFAVLFSWLLQQRISDTLCGTKVLWRSDYNKITANRSYFGNFDPFGDFDLLFGASKLNLKIIDLPIRYRDRTYGEIKISRWKHGWLLLKMSFIALWKLKLY